MRNLSTYNFRRLWSLGNLKILWNCNLAASIYHNIWYFIVFWDNYYGKGYLPNVILPDSENLLIFYSDYFIEEKGDKSKENNIHYIKDLPESAVCEYSNYSSSQTLPIFQNFKKVQ